MKWIAPPIESSPLLSLLLSVVAIVALPGSLPADDQPTDQSTVLLNNDQVLFGRAQQEGDRIVIEQADGGIIRMPVDRVLCWGPNLKALYQFRLDQRDRPSIRNHLIDARWCLNNGLYRESANELMQVYELSPGNGEAQRLEQQLRLLSDNVQQVTAEEPAVAPRVADHVHISPLATQQFTRVVQPILMNRCGACHDSGSEGKFSLLRLPGISRVSASMTHRNLQHVVTWIDTSDPMKSPLLEYSQRGHGGSDEAPLGKSQASAFASLAYWCSQFAIAPPAAEPSAMPIPTSAAISPFDQQQANASLVAVDAMPTPQQNPLPVEPAGESQPQRLPTVVDPFDPEIFNRKHHSQRTR
ncbi:hypothetical protein Poly24_35450 [Rosistilla carotiformis]|uniref:Cytochrome C Planctomycete-type domain-containing protein n=1 Tax=Rosistilla carotiformis TaxID=2528017 RepID=A0A518JWB1_9BACT|nr:hypothetical protein [Rosistilla carotiformis]QDV69828.1 hypothetical protein Poly24_35450 [Rosistilla carotiformis]